MLEFLRENPDQSGKREIARAFGLKGQQKIGLKALLRELHDEGLIKMMDRYSHNVYVVKDVFCCDNFVCGDKCRLSSSPRVTVW